MIPLRNILILQGADHLTVTWKVDEGVYQHVDVREEGKENAFSLGRSLWIDSEVRIILHLCPPVIVAIVFAQSFITLGK